MATPAIFMSIHETSLRADGSLPTELTPAKDSEVLTSGTANTRAAVKANAKNAIYFRVLTSADCYAAIGSSPNSAAEPRVLIKANTVERIRANAGDKIMVTTA